MSYQTTTCFFFLFVLISCSELFYRQQAAVNPYQSIRLEGADSTAVIHITSVKDIKTSDALHYHWFDKGQVFRTQGGYSGHLLDGTYTSHYTNGQLKESGQFGEGLKSGEWKTWYSTGQLKSSRSYKRGQLQGNFVDYDTQGNATEKGTFEQGVYQGKVTYYQQGQPSHVIAFKKGVATDTVQIEQ